MPIVEASQAGTRPILIAMMGNEIGERSEEEKAVRCRRSGRFPERALVSGEQLSNGAGQGGNAERLVDGYVGRQVRQPLSPDQVIDVEDRQLGEICRIRATSSGPVRP